MQTISRQEAKDLMDNRDDLVVVEALGADQFQKFHLPRAHNVPLDESFTENIQRVIPNPSTPVLVYCMDTECHASDKAGQKLEDLGYTEIYDYEAGKVDWKEAGLPIESPNGSST